MIRQNKDRKATIKKKNISNHFGTHMTGYIFAIFLSIGAAEQLLYQGHYFFLLFLSQKNSYPDKMLCISAKICIQTCWLLIVAKVLDQTDQILPKNQKSIQGKIHEAFRNYPYENCSFQMPQKPKAKCVFGNAYLLLFWFFCTTCLFTQPLFSDPIFWKFLLPSW